MTHITGSFVCLIGSFIFEMRSLTVFLGLTQSSWQQEILLSQHPEWRGLQIHSAVKEPESGKKLSPLVFSGKDTAESEPDLIWSLPLTFIQYLRAHKLHTFIHQRVTREIGAHTPCAKSDSTKPIF